jgi:hypothetical protein
MLWFISVTRENFNYTNLNIFMDGKVKTNNYFMILNPVMICLFMINKDRYYFLDYTKIV